MTSPFPDGVQVVNLTGRYLAPDGTPLSGYLTFTPPPSIILPAADTISATPVKATLDAHGRFSIWLIATDNSAMSPTGWAYKVQAVLNGLTPPLPPFHILLPAGTSPVDIADVAPTSPYPGSYLPVTGATGPQGPIGPPGPAPAPRRLLIFYAPPIAVTVPGISVGPNTTEYSAQVFAGYDHVVFGAGLQASGSPYHASTAAIIARMKQLNPTVRVYGYCDLGVTGGSSSNTSMTDLKAAVDAWVALGAGGIFLDQAGYDFGVTRARQNEIVDYVHAKTAGVIVNDADPDTLMGSTVDATYNPTGGATHLNSRDAYLLESWAVNTVTGVGYVDGYNSGSQIKARAEKAVGYRTSLGVKVFAANVIESTRLGGPAAGQYWGAAEALANVYALDAYGAGDIYYAASSAAVDLDLRYDPVTPAPRTTTGTPQWNGGLTEVARSDTGLTVHLDPTAHTYWYETSTTELRHPDGPAGGDLAGAYPAPSVHRVNGVTIGGTPSAGQVPTATGATAAAWATPAAIPTTLPPSGTASGDLTGAYPGPSVAAVRGITVSSGAPSSGQVLTASSSSAAAWAALPAAPTTLPPNGAAGGDLANTYPNPRVQGVTGVQVTNSPAAAAGAVLTANSSSSASWTVPTTPRLDQLPSPTAPVGLNAQKIIFLANGTTGTDAAAFGQIPVAGTTTGTYAAGDDSRITGGAQKSANLSDLASASTARTNLGLGGGATLSVGTTTGTLAAGDDSRITGAAAKASNLSDLASASTARTNLGLGGAAVLSVGTAAGTVAAGDDARITGAAQLAGDLSGTTASPKVGKIDGAALAGFNPGGAGYILTATSTTTAGWGPLPTLNVVPQPTADVNMNNHGLLNLGNTTVGFGGGSISFFGATQVTKPTTGAIAHPTDPVVAAILAALVSLGLITDATV